MTDHALPTQARPDSQAAEVTDDVASALRRLTAAGIDPIIPRRDCIVALNLSPPTVARMQQRRELPPFAEISPGRKGWRRSVLMDAVNGRRDWTTTG